MNTIGDRIAQLIKEMKLTRLRFGEEVGLTSGAVSRICHNDVVPSSATIKSICRTYNVNETWLLTGDGDMFKNWEEAAELGRILGTLAGDDSPRGKAIRTIMAHVVKWDDDMIDEIIALCEDVAAVAEANGEEEENPSDE